MSIDCAYTIIGSIVPKVDSLWVKHGWTYQVKEIYIDSESVVMVRYVVISDILPKLNLMKLREFLLEMEPLT